MKISAPRGTKDILPDETYRWRYVDETFAEICRLAGYEEIRVPTFEATELFARGVGDASDIVAKEMYTFEDKGGRSLTLRPEGTAGVVRAFIEHGMHSLPLPVKLYYNLNAFRYEKVQKGRYREFWQLGCEVFGPTSPEADADLIILLWQFFQRLGLNEIRLEINSIGCPACRPRYLEALKAYFEPQLDHMCGDCHERFEKNVLRMIDCKVETCQAIASGAPYQLDYLCEACREHDAALRARLDQVGVSYLVNGRIVRGLDYYVKTVFEFVSEHVGTQGTICGGGRYDGLVDQLGGQPMPGVGFAMGIERLLMELEATGAPLPERPGRDLYVLAFPDTMDLAAALVYGLRAGGVAADLDLMTRSFKAQMKYAGKGGYKALVVLGEDEANSGVGRLKWLQDGTETDVTLETDSLVRLFGDHNKR